MTNESLIRVKISGGPLDWQIVATDIDTGKILPVKRATFDLSNSPTGGPIIAKVELIVTELDIEVLADVRSKD